MQLTQPANRCFVCMPLSDCKGIKQATWDKIYEEIIRVAVEREGFTCQRADAKRGLLLDEILSPLCESQLVVVDLTRAKPNVLYELGIRHSYMSGTLLVTQRREDIPSDLAGLSYIPYSYRTEDQKAASVARIRAAIRNLLTQPEVSDSPVLRLRGTGPRKPLLDVRIFPGRTTTTAGPLGRVSFIHAVVVSSGPFAAGARCYVRFLDTANRSLFAELMPGRWSSAPEPIVPVSGRSNERGLEVVSALDASKLPYGYVTNLADGIQEPLGIAARFDEDGVCFGWTQESYFHNWRMEKWRLPTGILKAEIIVRVEGHNFRNILRFDSTTANQFITVEDATGFTAADYPASDRVVLEEPALPLSG